VCVHACVPACLMCVSGPLIVCAAAQLEIVTRLVNITLPQGSSHTFVCAVVADRQPVIVFRLNGERITSNSSKHTLVTNSTHGTLTVFNVQNSDEGNYSCSASNRDGSVSTSAVLTVQGAFRESVQCVGSRQF